MIFSLPGISFLRIKTGTVLRNAALFGFTLLFSLPLSSHVADGKHEPSAGVGYEIGRWRGFKKAAFTISFDDNYRYQVVYATPIINAHNYKATYFLVTNRIGKGWAPGWDTVNMLASEGHEIASHSKNHADFVHLSNDPSCADSMRHEFRDSRDSINARVPVQKCETFAWPGGEVDDSAINVGKKYYMACRGSIDRYEYPDPANPYNIYSQHIYSDTPLAAVNGYIDTIKMLDGWLVERWHGFRVEHDTNGYEPVPISEFQDHMDYVSQNEDSLWIAPLGQVMKYIRERDTSILSFVDSAGYDIRFSLTNPLSDTLFHYNVPLSLKVREYGKMADVYMITQDTNVLPFTVTEDFGYKYIYFDAVPNDSLIDMHLPYPAGIYDKYVLKNGAGNFPNPFTVSTTILFDPGEARYADIRVYDQCGRAIRNYSRRYPSGMNSIVFDGTGLPPGIYNCIINTGGKVMTVRLALVP
jgi:peptidoglycan/xylan/chitin deacetylase (PgdA/CDA1 family)